MPVWSGMAGFTGAHPKVTHQTCFSRLRANMWSSGGCILDLKGPNDRMMKGFIVCVCLPYIIPGHRRLCWCTELWACKRWKSSAKASASVSWVDWNCTYTQNPWGSVVLAGCGLSCVSYLNSYWNKKIYNKRNEKKEKRQTLVLCKTKCNRQPHSSLP